jgi:hypothetical protein
MSLQLTEHNRYLFEERDGTRVSGVVIELTETSALIKWDVSRNEVWYALQDFRPSFPIPAKMEVIEKLKRP